MAKFVVSAAHGFAFVISGIKYVNKNRSLIKWILIPLLVNTVLFSLFMYYFLAMAKVWTTDSIEYLNSTFLHSVITYFYYPILFVIGSLMILVSFLLIYIVSSIVSAPFHSLLAERTLMSLGAIQQRPFQFTVWIGLTFKMLFVSLIKAMFFLFISLVLTILSFVPGLNVVAAFGTLMMLAFDFFDYSLELMELNFSQRMKFGKNNLTTLTGMAGFLAISFVLPGSILFLSPFAVVGGALLIAKNKLGSHSYSE